MMKQPAPLRVIGCLRTGAWSCTTCFRVCTFASMLFITSEVIPGLMPTLSASEDIDKMLGLVNLAGIVRTVPVTEIRIPTESVEWDIRVLKLNEDTVILSYKALVQPEAMFDLQANLCTTLDKKSV